MTPDELTRPPTKLLGAGRQLGLALPDSLPPPPSPNLSIG